MASSICQSLFYGNPSTALTTIGVTGTNGKTTTTHLIRSILEAADIPTGVIGTIGYELGDLKLTPHGGVWEPEEVGTYICISQYPSTRFERSLIELSALLR